ncbi:MAG: hypothetical protein IPP47_19840 [Bryobacterales bacterium]|nr:hypothetical protein [Bryobacterales bacterium]
MRVETAVGDMRLLALIPLVGCVVAWGADSLTIRDDVRVRGIVYRSAIGRMSPAEFDKSALGLLAPDQVVIGAFAVFPSKREYFWVGPRYDLFDSSYDFWRKYLEESGVAAGRCPEMQEALKIDGQIVVRRVDAACKVTKTTLRKGGGRPLELRVACQPLEVLHLSFRPAPARGRTAGVYVRVYAKVAGPLVNERFGREATDELKRMTGAASFYLALRADALFLSDGTFPHVFLFDGKAGVVPSKDDYVRSRVVFCSATVRWPTNCFVSQRH